MWVGIAFSAGVSILFFVAIFKITNRWNVGSQQMWPFGSQILFLLSTFLEQDSPVLERTKSQPLRAFVIMWFFFTLVVANVYRSKMVTFLAFPVLAQLPKSFEELAFSEYQVGFVKYGDSAYNTLAASTDPVYVKLVNEMEIFTGVGLECLEKVVKHKYACIAYDFALDYLSERNMSDFNKRKLVIAPARTYNVWLGLATEGKSIYRMNFGKWLSYTRPFHLTDIWSKMDMYYNVRLLKLSWFKGTNQTMMMKQFEEESSNLTMKHIAGTFYVLVICLLLSLMVFCHELIVFCVS